MRERAQWPWTAFHVRNEYAQLPDADLAGLPRELNPYERLRIRLAFASGKALLLIPAGALVGWLLIWAHVAI